TVMGVGYGRFAGYPDAEPASWLLARGLLLPVTYSQLVVPREAALGLRGGLVFPTWPQPPVAETLHPLPDGPAPAGGARRAGGGRRGGPPAPPSPGSRWPGSGRGRWPSATSAAWPATSTSAT